MSRSGRFRRRVCSTFARQPGRPAVCWPATESQSPASAPTWPPPAASARPWPPDWTLAGTRSCPGRHTPGLRTRPGLPGAMRAVPGAVPGAGGRIAPPAGNVPGCSLPLSHHRPLTDPLTDTHTGYISLSSARGSQRAAGSNGRVPAACGSWLPRKPSVTGRVGAKRAGRCSVPVAGPRRWARLRRGQIRRCGHRCRRGGLWTASTDRGRY